jgi:hypothetical protein
VNTPLYAQYSTGYRWYVLLALKLDHIFNSIGRQVMIILLEPIKAEIDLIPPSNFAMVLCPANESVKSYERACRRTHGLLAAAQSTRAG